MGNHTHFMMHINTHGQFSSQSKRPPPTLPHTVDMQRDSPILLGSQPQGLKTATASKRNSWHLPTIDSSASNPAAHVGFPPAPSLQPPSIHVCLQQAAGTAYLWLHLIQLSSTTHLSQQKHPQQNATCLHVGAHLCLPPHLQRRSHQHQPPNLTKHHRAPHTWSNGM